MSHLLNTISNLAVSPKPTAATVKAVMLSFDLSKAQGAALFGVKYSKPADLVLFVDSDNFITASYPEHAAFVGKFMVPNFGPTSNITLWENEEGQIYDLECCCIHDTAHSDCMIEDREHKLKVMDSTVYYAMDAYIMEVHNM